MSIKQNITALCLGLAGLGLASTATRSAENIGAALALKGDQAYMCSIDETEMRTGGKVIGKRDKVKSEVFGIFSANQALHCAGKTCIDAKAAGVLSTGNMIFVSPEGDRIEVNVLSLEMGAGYLIKMGGPIDVEIIAIGTCAQSTVKGVNALLGKARK
jgi:hypothetical protein